MRHAFGRTVLAAAASVMLLPAAAEAHDLLLKPEAATVAAGAPLTVSAMLTEVYMKGDVIPPADKTTVTLRAGDKSVVVPMQPDEGAKVLRGTVPAPSAGTMLLLAARAGYRSKTPEGTKPVPKTAPGASETVRSESFAKALVNLSAADSGFGTVIGTRLEIVPLTNPGKPGADGTTRFKVLFDGKPLATKVTATYDGYSDKEDDVAVTAESGADGIVSIETASPGLWMLKASHRFDEATALHDRYAAGATVVFSVP